MYTYIYFTIIKINFEIFTFVRILQSAFTMRLHLLKKVSFKIALHHCGHLYFKKPSLMYF